MDAYQKDYAPLAQASIRALGGRLIAAGQNILVFEGPSPGTRVAITQFDNIDAVQAWRNSDSSRKRGRSGRNTRSSAPSLSKGSLNPPETGKEQIGQPRIAVLLEGSRDGVAPANGALGRRRS